MLERPVDLTAMAVRTFTKPNSLNQQIALATGNMPQQQPNDEARSEQAARTAVQSHPQSAQDPLAASGGNTSRPGITFAAQDRLPQLPIPDLESTCKKYLDSLRPLQAPKEHRDTQVALREFLKSDGPELQEKLRKYASGRSNYIEQFCKSFPLLTRMTSTLLILA
jgi:carnitine O-acetyltransferase